MRIEIDKEEYKDLIETKEEFLKTVRKLDNITIENIKLTDKYEQQLDQLKDKEQECEKLKEAIDRLLKIQYQLADSCNKYVQTLTEIKEFAENAAKCLYATKSDDYADGYRWLGSIILQKINECEERIWV